MKLTPIFLGISVAATTLSLSFANPAKAGDIQSFDSSSHTAKTFKVKKKKCFFKRFYVKGHYRHGRYIRPHYVVRKVCKFVRH
ncbi:MAG: hypothetical protein KME17_23155 [Cyanosarcina radialis HA8281-LM2]|jgi:hypothetical protein|nr:hypothetical protein [Cyanosarcina radialis HA8281-LM2]